MAYTLLGSKAVGSVIKIEENGENHDWIVVQQGLPSGSATLDSSCDGTWLMRKYCRTGNVSYQTSNARTKYAESNAAKVAEKFYDTFSTAVQECVLNVKINAYYPNSTPHFVNQSVRVFIPSAWELITKPSQLSFTEQESNILSYFKGLTTADSTLRVAYDGNGTNRPWWTRTPSSEGTSYLYNCAIGHDGDQYNRRVYNSVETNCVRPFMILNKASLLADDNTIVRNTAPTTPDGISYPSTIYGDDTITVSWTASTDKEGNLTGYMLERSLDGGDVWTQVYQGSETSVEDTVPFGSAYVAYRVRAYDAQWLKSDYQTGETAAVINNHAPTAPATISVPANVNGGSPLTITWTAASDVDDNLRGYVLWRRVDSGQGTQVYKGNALSYTDSITKGWNTVQYTVYAYDSYDWLSDCTTSPVRTVKNNTAPTITTSSAESLGTKASGFTISYSVNDVDSGDTITVKELLDGVTKRTFTATRNATNSFAVTGDYFQKILNGTHTLTISASDGKETTVKKFTFTKLVTAASITLEEPMTADSQITLCVITVSGSIPDAATFSVKVTNNANDSSPVWEDATSAVKKGVNYLFTNTTATNGFAFNFKVTANRGSSSGGYITSIQGGFQ